MLAVGALVVMLSGFSPVFATLLVLPTPLRAVNHYSDAAFVWGISSIVILLAAQGLEAAIRPFTGLALLVQRYFLACVALGVVAFVAVYGDQWRGEWLFGFFLVSSLATVLVLQRAKRGTRFRRLLPILLAILLIDVSTNAFWWVREVAAPLTVKSPMAEDGRYAVIPKPSPEKPFPDYSSFLLAHRDVIGARALYGGEIDALPEFAFAALAQPLGTSQSTNRTVSENLKKGVIELPLQSLNDPAYARFSMSENPSAPRGHLAITARTYSSVHLAVDLERPALLFWKGLHDPMWRARVNQEATPTAAAYGAFTAFPLPAGKSEVLLQYRPPILPWILAGAVISLLIAGALAVFTTRVVLFRA